MELDNFIGANIEYYEDGDEVHSNDMILDYKYSRVMQFITFVLSSGKDLTMWLINGTLYTTYKYRITRDNFKLTNIN